MFYNIYLFDYIIFFLGVVLFVLCIAHALEECLYSWLDGLEEIAYYLSVVWYEKLNSFDFTLKLQFNAYTCKLPGKIPIYFNLIFKYEIYTELDISKLYI